MAGVTDVNNETPPDQDGSRAASGGAGASGLPLRGLAMVLIAVAVLFGLWALYSFTQGGDERTATGASQTVSGTMTEPEAGSGAGQDPAATDTDTDADADADARADAARDQDQGRDAEDTATSRTGAPAASAPNNAGNANNADAVAPAGGGAVSEADVKDVTVNVVNNSTISGLAEETYNDLRERGYKVGEHGNLPEQDLDRPLPETTVFYHPDDRAGEKAAEELATELAETYKVPTTTAPNIEQLPEDVARPGNVTLALIGELAPRQ